MWKEFKAFIAKGNVMDMAVGVIIGGAFGKIVSSLVSDIFTPLISLITGSANFSDLKIVLKAAELAEDGTELVPAATLNYGMFIQNVIDFFVIALCVFLLVKIVNTVRVKAEELVKKPEPEKEEEPEKEPEPTKEEILLTEIRDLLKETAQK